MDGQRLVVTDQVWRRLERHLPGKSGDAGGTARDNRIGCFPKPCSGACAPGHRGAVRHPPSGTAIPGSDGFAAGPGRVYSRILSMPWVMTRTLNMRSSMAPPFRFKPPRVYRRLFCSKPMRPCQGRSCLHGRRPPFPAGGRWPMAPCSRPVLYQMTHCRVSHSNRATDFHGPKNPMTPVLNRPITLSARALSWLSPTLQAEMSIPASARHSV